MLLEYLLYNVIYLLYLVFPEGIKVRHSFGWKITRFHRNTMKPTRRSESFKKFKFAHYFEKEMNIAYEKVTLLNLIILYDYCKRV